MPNLVLIRHGKSEWNLDNKFTGWVDIPLCEEGRKEAINAGKKIYRMDFDAAYTSTLIRAQETLLLVCSELKSKKVPIFQHDEGKLKSWAKYSSVEGNELPVKIAWQLNERHYGKLQGMNKDDMRKKYGEEQVHVWRRSYDIRPPEGECLKDTAQRTIPYFKKHILKDINAGKNVLIAAHGNSLRSIVMNLDKLTPEEVVNLEIPTGVPIIYKFDKKGKILSKKILR